MSVACVETLEEALLIVKKHGADTYTKFAVHKSTKGFGNTGFETASRVYWEDRSTVKLGRLEFDGIPFVILGHKTFDCQFGKDRKVQFKLRRKKEMVDEPERGRGKNVQSTKKVDCPARCVIREIVKFPSHKVTLKQIEETNKRKCAEVDIMAKIRNGEQTGEGFSYNRLFVVCLPAAEEHHGHPLEGAIAEMSCINCCKDFNIRLKTTRYLKPNLLTHKLQDKKQPGALKPDVTILDALENISDGDVTPERLKLHSVHYICHECHINLRQAVNKKAEVEHNLQLLIDRVSQVSNLERRKYYREHYGTDKQGRCWSCMYQFVPADYQKKRSDRLNMATPVVQGLSVCEAINSLLEKEADTLIGLYEKSTYVCKHCIQLLRNVIRPQCVFDTLHTTFTSLTNGNSVFARLFRGEDVPFTSQILNEFGNTADTDTYITVGNTEYKNELPDTYVQNVTTTVKRPFQKTFGNVSMAQLPPSPISKKSKKNMTDYKHNYSSTERNNTVCETVTYYPEIVNADCKAENTEYEVENACADLVNINYDTIQTESEVQNNDSGILFEDTVNAPEIIDLGINMEVEEIDSGKEAEDEPKGVVHKDRQNVEGTVAKRKHFQIKLSLHGKELKVVTAQEIGCGTTILTAPEIPSISAVGVESENRETLEDWVLYYYPKFSGRAECIRLIFEAAGVPYRECEESIADVKRLVIHGEMEGYPHFAPPMIKKGSLQVSQAPVICRFLGEEFGLYPASKEDRLHAEQINQCCHDFITEGRLSFHGIRHTGSYATQKEETQPYIDRFVSERLPRWLKYFERVLNANNDGKWFLYGQKMCYTDLTLFHILRATESQFPKVYKAANYIPSLKAFKDRTASVDTIALYLKSDRCREFCGDSMM